MIDFITAYFYKKGLGNKFPKFNPQDGLCSSEEKSIAPDELRLHSSFAKQSADKFQG